MKEINIENKIDRLSKKIYLYLTIIIIVAVIYGLFITSLYFINFNAGLSNAHNKWGLFGDYIGGLLNPFYSFLALIAILLTIVVQSRELQLSTIELARSAKALDEQSKLINHQNFENTFFQMIRLHNDIVTSIDIEDIKGRDCFEYFYERFTKSYNLESKKENDLEMIQASYQIFFNTYQREIGHYFRNLYTIIRYVHDSDTEKDKTEKENKEKKMKYIRIIRAQLSSYELALLFYNSLHTVGNKKFKPLIEEYSLLQNMDLGLLKNPPDHIPLYRSTAFGEQDLSRYLHN